MADKTIGDLPAANALYDTDLMVLEQNGEAKNMPGTVLKNYLKPYADAAEAASEAAESALAGVKDAINNIPEGAATPIVNDLTTGGASMALSAEMGKELGKRPNPNLLDNWYFANPVNQRGLTEYTASAYTVDRWRKFLSDAVSVVDGGIQLEYTGTTAYLNLLTQYLDDWEQYRGKTITVSALLENVSGTIGMGINDGSLHPSNHLTNAGLLVQTYTVKANATTLYTNFYAPIGGPVSAKIIAAKLELGTQQTLAHQDENGNWVLNEIPDYNEQLLRCCMSTADSSDTYANNKLTAAAVNALPLDGSKAMTGNLYVDRGTLHGKMQVKRSNANGNVAMSEISVSPVTRNGGWGGAQLLLTRDSAEIACLRLFDGNTLELVDLIAGTYKSIFHTGNKPSGGYTGNGSATARTIDTGGIGEAIIIYSGYGIAIVTRRVTLIADGSGAKAVASSGIGAFSAGTLTLLTTDTVINANGVTYYYQVL